MLAMPEMRNYIVTQTRDVKVTANNEVDAVSIAAAAFEHGQNSDVSVVRNKAPVGIWGNTSNRIRVIEIRAIDLQPRRST
jgi:hypothetical protein